MVSISIHALHEESDRQHEQDDADERISIHALHEESDENFAAHYISFMDFNPRSP